MTIVNHGDQASLGKSIYTVQLSILSLPIHYGYLYRDLEKLGNIFIFEHCIS